LLENPAFRNTVLAKIKPGRIAQPRDIMGAITFLASNAANIITGTSIVIDGRWTAD